MVRTGKATLLKLCRTFGIGSSHRTRLKMTSRQLVCNTRQLGVLALM